MKILRKTKGITLIALIVTIILLLILAGISLQLIGGSNGILNRTENSVTMTKIKEVEELAQMSYMGRRMDEITEGRDTIIAGVISDLKEEGYTIKQEAENGNHIIGITLNEESITIERGTNQTISYTLVYSGETEVRYFVEIQGKYYEIDFYTGGDITISTEEVNLGEISKEPNVTVESSDSSIIEATKTEEGKIVLTAKDKIGDVEITIKEETSNITKKITATTRIATTGISISPTEKTIKMGETVNLTATIEPSNATDKAITWSSSNTGVATVENGVVTAVAGGTTTITAVVAGISSNACTIIVTDPTLLDKVKENPADFYGKKVKGYTANGISDWRIFYADEENVFIITTDYVPNSKVPTSACGMTIRGSYEVWWDSIPSVASTANVDKFSPVTAETMKWTGNYGTHSSGKCVSTLLDTSKWTGFVDTGKAKMAIGSPTLNMWVASWNAKYPSEKIYCNNSNATGYYIGMGNKPSSYYIGSNIMSATIGYKVAEAENMYFPHKSEWNSIWGYLIASPSAYNTTPSIVQLQAQSARFFYAISYHKNLSVRPVVCLKSDVKITENADGSVTLK